MTPPLSINMLDSKTKKIDLLSMEIKTLFFFNMLLEFIKELQILGMSEALQEQQRSPAMDSSTECGEGVEPRELQDQCEYLDCDKANEGDEQIPNPVELRKDFPTSMFPSDL